MSNFVEEFLVGLGFEFEGEEGERFKKQTQQISSVINALSAAALAASTALFAMSKAQGEAAYAAATTAKVMDTSAQNLGKWRYAAERAGTTGEAVVGMLQGLRNASQDAMRNGSGPFRAFQELGVDFEGIANGSVDVTDALDSIISKAQQLDRATAQSGLRELGIDPVFLDTPIARLREFMAEYQKFGGMTDKLIEQGGRLDVAMAGAGLRFEGIANMLSERLIPTYVKFFEALSDGLEWLQETGFPIMDKFVEKMGGWDVILGTLAVASIPAVIAGLGTLTRLLGLVTGGFGAAAAAGGLLATGALAAIGGAGGYYAGDLMRRSLPQDAVDTMDDYTLRALAYLGVDSAVKQLEANQAARDEGQQFIDMMEYQTAHPEDGIDKPGNHSGLMDAIIGRESGGRTGLTSSKGAMGLAQLMPDTARQMAAELGIQYDQDKLLNDGMYNRILGQAYLNKMLQRYGGNEGLATAAYNAGPGSVDKWLKTNGDPRTGNISLADWVAAIPFEETRKYTTGVLSDKASMIPPPAPLGTAGNMGGTPVQRITHNTFNGLKQEEIEAMLRRAEQDEHEMMMNETRDSLVR